MNDLTEATRLATRIWARHYQKESPDWEPLETLSGVLSQIDNMAAGLINEVESLRRSRVRCHQYAGCTEGNCRLEGEECSMQGRNT